METIEVLTFKIILNFYIWISRNQIIRLVYR